MQPVAQTSTSIFSTERHDAWWVAPLFTALGLGCFAIYSTWAAFQGNHYEWGPYLSPFYSPLIKIPGVSISPAILILWAPLGFRATCYYYRKAYYRSFFLDPPACAVGEPNKGFYRGETKFPFILQNIHRYFMYIALIFIAILWFDTIKAFRWDGHFGMGVGTLIMLANIVFLSSYTFGCHSLRHVVGGRIDCFSCTQFGKMHFKRWSMVSCLNQRHMLFAWCSLFTVGFTDFYIRMCSMGIFHDIRIF